jgi:hypothetical protein
MTMKTLLKLTIFALISAGVPALGQSAPPVGSAPPAGSAPKAHRDWTKHPAVIQVDTTEEILAVGDAHADPTRLLGVLIAAKIIKGVPKKSSGIQWTAGNQGSTPPDPEALLTEYAKTLGVRHIVQGHQPGSVDFPDGKKRGKEDLFQRYGLLFLIDGGMSQGIEGSTSTGGALRISGSNPQTVVATCANGKTATLWDSGTNQEMEAIHCGQ